MMTKIKHLYIHVPFCKNICYYCDFCRTGYNFQLADRWLDQLFNEINEKCNDQYETIYIGGGTPSSLSDAQLDRLLSYIDPYAKKVIEYTFEANPESLSQNKIDILVKHNVNRISLGLQTTDPALLKSINRKHSFDDVKEVISNLKNSGINNISVDLMYSLPGQTIEILENTIEDVLSLDIPHISIYSLTIEENSVFGRRNVQRLDDDTEADMYEMIISKLTEKAYQYYEISNFAKPGKESKHNLGYWKYEDFLGISCGAASKVGNRRYTNTTDIRKYLEDYHILDEDLVLDKEDMMFENIMMSLRTDNGLDINEFNKKYECDFTAKYKDALNNRNLIIEDGILRCTNRALLNSVLIDFM